jgi:hypothetical protein
MTLRLSLTFIFRQQDDMDAIKATATGLRDLARRLRALPEESFTADTDMRLRRKISMRIVDRAKIEESDHEIVLTLDHVEFSDTIYGSASLGPLGRLPPKA